MTTIALDKELKNELQSFGTKGETYADIIKRLLESAKQRQLRDLLMSEQDTVPIEQAINDAEEEWPGS